jgi:hypothetical protein
LIAGRSLASFGRAAVQSGPQSRNGSLERLDGRLKCRDARVEVWRGASALSQYWGWRQRES